MLHKALVCSHLEYANAVWSPYKKCDIYVLEGVQRKATKLINSIKHLTLGQRGVNSFGIMLLSCIETELRLILCFLPPSWISDFWFHPTVFLMVPLKCLLPKT